MQLFLSFRGDESPEVNELIGVFGSKKSGLSPNSFYIKECILNISLEG